MPAKCGRPPGAASSSGDLATPVEFLPTRYSVQLFSSTLGTYGRRHRSQDLIRIILKTREAGPGSISAMRSLVSNPKCNRLNHAPPFDPAHGCSELEFFFGCNRLHSKVPLEGVPERPFLSMPSPEQSGTQQGQDSVDQAAHSKPHPTFVARGCPTRKISEGVRHSNPEETRGEEKIREHRDQ